MSNANKEGGRHVQSEPEPRRLFELGQVVGTPGAAAALGAAGADVLQLLTRHVTGDWGTLPEEDAEANKQALQNGARIFSGYDLAGGTRMWVITEADRSSTCLLLPIDY